MTNKFFVGFFIVEEDENDIKSFPQGTIKEFETWKEAEDFISKWENRMRKKSKETKNFSEDDVRKTIRKSIDKMKKNKELMSLCDGDQESGMPAAGTNITKSINK